jgi:hypothetical protein
MRFFGYCADVETLPFDNMGFNRNLDVVFMHGKKNFQQTFAQLHGTTGEQATISEIGL